VAPRAALVLSGLLALAGCASVPGDDGLLASTPIVRELQRESGDVVQVARFSSLEPGAALPEQWMPWGVNSGKRLTRYRLADGGGGAALEAYADGGASGLQRHIRVDPHQQPVLEWSWRVDRLSPDADPYYARRDDSAARLVVSFHGDASKLDFNQRAQMRVINAVLGEKLPYAMLIYVWASALPVGSVVPNPHFDRIKLLVVESGAAHLGQWRHYRRNVVADYRRAFGEDPGDIVSVGVMTDSDSERHPAHGYYGDISLRAP
jgi:Protein of unknown function (DUF3047)